MSARFAHTSDAYFGFFPKHLLSILPPHSLEWHEFCEKLYPEQNDPFDTHSPNAQGDELEKQAYDFRNKQCHVASTARFNLFLERALTAISAGNTRFVVKVDEGMDVRMAPIPQLERYGWIFRPNQSDHSRLTFVLNSNGAWVGDVVDDNED